MSNLAPHPSQDEGQLQRLLEEKFAGDREAVRQVQALIRALRAALPAERWEGAAPARCDYGRIPHS